MAISKEEHIQAVKHAEALFRYVDRLNRLQITDEEKTDCFATIIGLKNVAYVAIGKAFILENS